MWRAWCVTQSRRHFGTVDHGWRDVELLLQLSGRPQDLWPFLPIRPHLLFSTILLYSTTLLYNLLYKSTPSHLFSTTTPPPPLALFTTQPPTFLLLQTQSSLCLIERLDFQMLTQKVDVMKKVSCHVYNFLVRSNTSVVLKHSRMKISAGKSDNYSLVKWPSCGVFSVQSMWPNDLWPFLRDHQLERQKIVGKLEIMSCLQTLHFN